MENQALVNQTSGEAVLSLAEGAKQTFMTESSFRRWLQTNGGLDYYKALPKQVHTCTVSNITRRMTVIPLTVVKSIALNKSFPASNQHERKSAAPSLLGEKSGLVPVEPQSITIPDVKQLALSIVDDLAQSLITTEQKRILDDMVKMATFKKLGIKFGEKYDGWIYSRNIKDLRNYLNAYIGRKIIDNYTHLDYIRAHKYLKTLL